MASIRKEVHINAAPDEVWDALRDVGALHTRLVPGFVVDTQMDGDARIVTFGSGMTARERIVSVDDSARRVVWSVVGSPFEHHNGAAQVLAERDGTTRFVWTADLLPHELAGPIGAMMEQGIQVIRATMEGADSGR